MKISKLLPMMIVFLFFVSSVHLAFATNSNGDGTYKMYLLDTVKSSNDFVVELKNISYHYDQSKKIVIDTATYDVKMDGVLLSTLVLREGTSDRVSIESGHRNVTVTAVSFGSESTNANVAYIVKYFANTKVESATYVPPPVIIDVNITSLVVNPGFFSALASWNTNVSSSGLVYLYNKSSANIMKTIIDPPVGTTHSLNITGLKSDTNYSVVIQACTSASCVNSSVRDFKTLAVYPVISNVLVEETTNDTAIISWETDVLSDAHVYYRVYGTSEWKQAPPDLAWAQISQFFIFNFSESEKPLKPTVVSLAGKDNKNANFALPSGSPPSIAKSIIPSSLPTEYSINSDLISSISDLSAIGFIIKDTHTIKLSNLESNKTYQYKVSSCADRCVNSSVGMFKTEITILNPYANIVSAPTSVNHGTSAVLTVSGYSRNPRGYLTTAQLSWVDQGVTKTLIPKFGDDAKSFVPSSLPTISVVSITFNDPGTHTITFTVTDNYSKTSTDTVTINVGSKTKCTSTSVKYYPTDTPCTNKWPNNGGATIDYNNEIGACHAFEVCDDNLDFMVADAESCCNGEFVFSSEPSKNRGYNYDKTATCYNALWNTRNKGAMTSLGAESSMKMCKASYLVYGIGSSAVYVKDYYTAEGCCKDSGICGSNPRFQAYNPWPAANIKYNELWCYYYDAWIFGKYARDGWYGSDTNPSSNNNALADFPAHATVNVMNTGTCVDYSFVVTTSLRKAGFGKNEIMSMRTPGHLYNVVWLPGDTKYSFIDTVGNNGGDFFTGPGWDWESGGHHRDHCGYDSNHCSNDNGMKNCPTKSNVWGC